MGSRVPPWEELLYTLTSEKSQVWLDKKFRIQISAFAFLIKVKERKKLSVCASTCLSKRITPTWATQSVPHQLGAQQDCLQNERQTKKLPKLKSQFPTGESKSNDFLILHLLSDSRHLQHSSSIQTFPFHSVLDSPGSPHLLPHSHSFYRGLSLSETSLITNAPRSRSLAAAAPILSLQQSDCLLFHSTITSLFSSNKLFKRNNIFPSPTPPTFNSVSDT